MKNAKEIVETLNKFTEEEQGEDLDEILVELSDIYNSIEDEKLRIGFINQVKKFINNYKNGTNDGIIVNATWNVNSNALGYKNPNNYRESFRNAIIGAKDGQDIIKRLEKEGGILDGWGKARGYKVEVMEEKPQYIKIGFGGQVVLTVSKIERG